jgi:hypothetical protein
MNKRKILSVIGAALMLTLCIFVSQPVHSVPYPYKTIIKTEVYADTAATNKLGKIKQRHKINVFATEGNFAKIRYNEQWAYVKVQDITLELTGWWEVTANTLNVYQEAGSKKQIASLKKGTVLYIDVVDNINSTKQFAAVRYNLDYQKRIYSDDNGKKGFVSLAYIQPLPEYYEVITTSHRYKKPDVKADIGQYGDLKCGDRISVGKYHFRNEKWAEYLGEYIEIKNIKALPDSINADLQEKWELELEQGTGWGDFDDLKDYGYWIILGLTFSSLFIFMIFSHDRFAKWTEKNYIAIVVIPLYLNAVLILLCEYWMPHSLADPFANIFLSGRFFKEVGKLILIAGVLSINLFIVVDVFRDIRFSKHGNFFIALLVLVFPAAVMSVAFINAASILGAVAIIFMFCGFIFGNEGSGSSAKKAEGPRLGGGQHCSTCSQCLGHHCKQFNEHIPDPNNMTCDHWSVAYWK